MPKKSELSLPNTPLQSNVQNEENTASNPFAISTQQISQFLSLERQQPVSRQWHLLFIACKRQKNNFDGLSDTSKAAHLAFMIQFYTELARKKPQIFMWIDMSFELSLAIQQIELSDRANAEKNYKNYLVLLKLLVIQNKDKPENYKPIFDPQYLNLLVQNPYEIFSNFKSGIIFPALVDILIIMKGQGRPSDDPCYLTITIFLKSVLSKNFLREKSLSKGNSHVNISETDSNYFFENFLDFLETIDDIALAENFLKNKSTIKDPSYKDYFEKKSLLICYLIELQKENIIEFSILQIEAKLEIHQRNYFDAVDYEKACNEFYLLKDKRLWQNYYSRFFKENFNSRLQNEFAINTKKSYLEWLSFLIKKCAEFITHLDKETLDCIVMKACMIEKFDIKNLQTEFFIILRAYISFNYTESKLIEIANDYAKHAINRNENSDFEKLADHKGAHLIFCFFWVMLDLQINPYFLLATFKRILEAFKNSKKKFSTNNEILTQLEQTIETLNGIDKNHSAEEIIINIFYTKNLSLYTRIALELIVTRIIQQNMATQPETSPTLEIFIPPILNLYFSSIDDTIKREKLLKNYHRFASKYQKANAHAEADYRIPFENFMSLNQGKIIDLISIMEEHSFNFLSSPSFLGPSALELNRFIDKYRIMPHRELLNKIFKRFNNHFLKFPVDLKNFFIRICSVDLLIEKIGSLETSTISKELKEKVLVAASINELFSYLADILSKILSILLRVPLQKIDLNKIPFGRLSQLLLAIKNMAKDNYEDVFLQMLKVDFSTDQSFNDFAENFNQESPIGKRLSLYNAAIKKELSLAGVNLELADHYPKSELFSVENEGEIDIGNLLNTIWRNILAFEKNLKQAISKKPSNLIIEKLLAETEKDLNNIKKQVLKNNRGNEERPSLNSLNILKSEPIRNIRNKIFLKIESFKSKDTSREYFTFLRSIYEFADHWQKSCNVLTEAMMAIKASGFSLPTQLSQPKKAYYFEVWDKNKVDTLFLGDWVSCCLATDGAQFPAIVQRRMDKAMFFIVGIDAQSKEPVTLSWLFYGKDQQKPEDIYVVSNFFEIRAGLGLKKLLRQGLLSRLLLYIGEFSEDIKTKGFLIRPLTYGYMTEDITFLDNIEIGVDKVGGFFPPTSNASANESNYYLDALYINEFQLFNRAEVINHFTVKPVAKQKVISIVSEAIEPTPDSSRYTPTLGPQ